MATSFKNRKNKLLALLMALMMTSSFTALAACNDSEDSSSTDSTTDDSTVTETDDSHINNGSFEFVNWNSGKNLIITSPTGWSRSTNSATSGTAVSSKSASGIIDTDADAWDNFTKSSLPAGTTAPTTADEAKNLWSEMSAYDKLQFYKAWDDADYEEKLEDQEFYDASKDKFNVDIDDVPTVENPGIHPTFDDNGDVVDNEDADSNVLMIHNAYTNGVGTAQKYTSSSTITLQSGTSAKVSVWVKTSDLTYNDGNSAISERGAYIGITHTVGGKTLDQMQVKNINTELMDLDDKYNGWAQYTFYLQGCSYASSTFTMVLGLGQSGGTDRFEYVEGYAFFDDVECEIISNEAYANAVNPNVIPEVALGAEADEKIFRADESGNRNKTTYALNLTKGATSFNAFTLPNLASSIGLTEEKKNNTVYVAANDGNANHTVWPGLNLSTADDFTGVYTKEQLVSASATNNYVKAALEKGFGYEVDQENSTYKMNDYPFDSDQILMLLSAGGANYTAKVSDSAFTLKAGEKMGLSFFVKTSDMLGVTGASVTVRYSNGSSVISSIDTTGVATVDVDDAEDIYKGWQQCFLFVENDTETDNLSFTLEFSYGTSTIVGSTKDNYVEGWAAFADFKIADMSDAFDYASAGTYSKIVSLIDPNEETFSSSIFDSPAYVTGAETIKTNIANPRNYIGVVGGSGYVTNNPSADRSKNSNAYAGLISKEYMDAYVQEASTAGNDYWLNQMNLDAAGLAGLFKNGTKSYGEATQPLLIYNKEASAYGFIATTATTISSYTAISVRVKASAGAVATIYLADMDDSTHESVLSIDRRVTYWYDKDGNVCAKDPTSDDFKKSDILLKLQSNGLYQAANGGTYYANLQAYAGYGEGKDLLVAEGGVEYDYNSYWNDEGEDGIAFYYKDGKYYADAAKTVEVKDFSDKNIPTRYGAASKKDLSVTVDNENGTNGEWKTITFYIGAGSQPKNYRLEVWSGSRDGKVTSAANSYVLFDTNTAGSLDSTSYETLANGAFEYLAAQKDDQDNLVYANQDALKEALKKNGNLLYTAYSFYDDATFLRYNSSLDENEIGNKYDDYDSTSASYSEVMSYLYYENSDLNAISVFANYTQNDVTVPVDVEENTTTEDPTIEEEDNEADHNLGMLISSLAVAGVLVAVLVIIGVRKAVKYAKKKAAQAARPVRVKPEKLVKKPVVKEEVKEEDSPYND